MKGRELIDRVQELVHLDVENDRVDELTRMALHLVKEYAELCEDWGKREAERSKGGGNHR